MPQNDPLWRKSCVRPSVKIHKYQRLMALIILSYQGFDVQDVARLVGQSTIYYRRIYEILYTSKYATSLC